MARAFRGGAFFPTVGVVRSLLRTGLAVLALVAFMAAGLAAAECQSADRKHPNILIVLTDDMGFGDIRAHGNEQIDTPVLDGLAGEGARFERFYVSPVCAPTRASLLTGRYALRAGVHHVTRAGETMRAGEVTLAETLRSAGYATGCFGKWHNGAHYPQHPNGQGFEEFFGFCGGHWNNYHDAVLEHNGQPVATGGFITDVLTRRALEFIAAHRDKPWLCYLAYNAPHSPWQAPDRLWEKYRDRLPDDLPTACAYAMVENIDENLGRLLEQLDRWQLSRETIVVFLTDNGANTDRYDAGMRGQKGSLHEGGSRVPLFIRYPGRIKPGTQVTPITAHIDLLPTLLELAGVSRGEGPPLDGRSLVPLLEGHATDWPQRILFNHWGGTAPDRGAVRTQRWRAVKQRDRWQLFDIEADPGEQRDVSAQQPETLAELTAAFDAWFADVTSRGFDYIPAEIGHAYRAAVTLPAHEALLQPAPGQGIGYHGPAGWANDWISGWTSTEAYPLWPVEIVRSGRYGFTLLYCVPAGDLGAEVAVEIQGQRLLGTIRDAHDPEPLPPRDRVPRKEANEKTWATLDLGTLNLEPGPASLTVRALSRPGKQVLELKGVRVERLD